MPVYLIRAGTRGPVKIGYSDDVPSRLMKMQADNHARLTVLRVLEGGLAEEAMLHARFTGSRLHGEWFRFSKVMRGDLGMEDAMRTLEDVTAALRKLTVASRAAAALRPPEPEPTEAERAALTEKLQELVSLSRLRSEQRLARRERDE